MKMKQLIKTMSAVQYERIMRDRPHLQHLIKKEYLDCTMFEIIQTCLIFDISFKDMYDKYIESIDFTTEK